jgi:hypothetical protein
MLRRSLFFVIALMGFSPAAHAAPTQQQLCESAMELASAKYAQCRLNAESKDTKKPDAMKLSDALGKCSQKLSDAFTKATDKYGVDCAATEPSSAFDAYLKQCSDNTTAAAGGAALPGVCGNGTIESPEACEVGNLNGKTCQTQGFAGGTLGCAAGCTLDTSGCWATRFVDNGNGTVTDNQTKLVWEKKTTAVGSGANLADPHDVDNTYSWGSNTAPYPPNGTAFTDFLARLNGSADGVCFAGQCDWRLPTLAELQGIVDCGAGSPCISGVFGPTVPGGGFYWSSSTHALSPQYAWDVYFGGGPGVADPKYFNFYVRAVRGGS